MNRFAQPQPNVRLAPGVLQCIEHAAALGGNPASLHKLGRQARAVVDRCTAAVTRYLQRHGDTVIFCASIPEARQLALQSLDLTLAHKHPGACILNAPRLLEQNTATLPPHPYILDLQTTACVLSHPDLQACVASSIAHAQAVILDSACVRGPGGVVALCAGAQMRLQPLWAGGGQFDGVRSGTPPVALLAGFAQALQYCACADHQTPLSDAMSPTFAPG